MSHLNVEIKARCKNQDGVRNYLKKNNAKLKGTDHQIDTYFVCHSGRLKLREGNVENYLIHYDREDKAGPKQSLVTLFENKPKSSLRELLTKALGVLVIVDKRREIYFIDNVKFHVDSVKGLGAFVEIEAIGGKHESEKLNKQCHFFMKELGIEKDDLLTASYSDLLLETSKNT